MRYTEGTRSTFAAEGDNQIPLPDPEEVKKRYEQMERTLSRLARNVKSLREKLMSMLDRLPDSPSPDEPPTGQEEPNKKKQDSADDQ